MIHQLTKSEANVSATPHQKGIKKAPQLKRANKSQKDFFCESKICSLRNTRKQEPHAGR
jgi:hypothetical protein